jgi:hypothetical protein
MDQLFKSEEQEQFYQALKNHFHARNEIAQGPLFLEAGAGVGKTRAFLLALFEACSAGGKVTLAVPSHMLMDQILGGKDLAFVQALHPSVSIMGFKPKSKFENSRDYKKHKKSCTESSVMICTQASVMIDHHSGGQYNGSSVRDYLLFDEADQWQSAAGFSTAISIDSQDYREIRKQHPGCFKSQGNLARDLFTFKASAPGKGATGNGDLRARLLAMSNIVVSPELSAAFEIKFNPDGTSPLQMLLHNPLAMLRGLFRRGNIAFSSETLTVSSNERNPASPEYFKSFSRMTLGRSDVSFALFHSQSIQPKNHGKATIRVHPYEVPDSEDVAASDWMSAICDHISCKGVLGPILVATTSFEFGIVLKDRLALADPEIAVINRERGVDVLEVVKTLAAQPPGKKLVLISPAVWAGLDTGIAWKSIVVPKIPFASYRFEDRLDASARDTDESAIRRMTRVLGRGLRHPDAEVTLDVFDGRFTRVQGFVPERFKTSIFEIKKEKTNEQEESEVLEGFETEIRAERTFFSRNPHVRARAMRHHGFKCMACELASPGDESKTFAESFRLTVLEVHQKKPISEGFVKVAEVATDVLVLCPTCHVIEHKKASQLTQEK